MSPNEHIEKNALRTTVMEIVTAGPNPLPPEVIAACQQNLNEHFEIPADKRLVEADLLSDKYYAIQNSEIDFVTESINLAKDILVDWDPVTGIEGIGKLVTLLIQYRQDRVELSNLKGLVLLALKGSNKKGLNPDQIRIQLPLKEDSRPTIDLVRKTLASLRDVKAGNKRVELVIEEDGVWYANDV